MEALAGTICKGSMEKGEGDLRKLRKLRGRMRCRTPEPHAEHPSCQAASTSEYRHAKSQIQAFRRPLMN